MSVRQAYDQSEEMPDSNSHMMNSNVALGKRSQGPFENSVPHSPSGLTIEAMDPFHYMDQSNKIVKMDEGSPSLNLNLPGLLSTPLKSKYYMDATDTNILADRLDDDISDSKSHAESFNALGDFIHTKKNDENSYTLDDL